MISRRQFLGGAGLLAWSTRSMAQEATTGPKRLIIVHHPQGTSMQHFVPQGTPNDFQLSYILSPLLPHREKMLVLTGIDNRITELNSVATAHPNAAYTFLTGDLFLTQDPSRLTAGGPSIEQVIAERFGNITPYQRLDFAIGGTRNESGIFLPDEEHHFWYGPSDPVAAFNNPYTALQRIFGISELSPEEQWSINANRAAALQSVLRNFDLMKRNYGSSESPLLDAHADKVEQLFHRMSSSIGTCARPNISLPYNYDYSYDDNLSAPVLNQILVTAMACDYTRVATLSFANAHDHGFEWLWQQNNNRPIVDRSQWDNWHAMVHADYQPGIEHVYRWYMEQLSSFLNLLANTNDVDGDNMLDHSLVVSISEFSSGRHWHNSLPILLFGNLGSIATNRWVDFMSVDTNTFIEGSGMAVSGFTTNQLWTTLLHIFGHSDEHFGARDNSLPIGPLPNI